MSSTHQVAGNQLTLLRNGEEYFPRILAAVHAARHSIYLETYIFAADHSGRLMKEALGSAASREVSVHLLIDGFGSANLPGAWIDEMRRLGVKVLWFRRELARLRLRRRHLRRLHRKLALIDERIAFVGGINITDDVPAGMHAPRLDYSVQMQGPIVAHVSYSMRRLWQLVSWANFKTSGNRSILFSQKPSSQKEVALLIRDNVRHRRDIEHAYLRAIHHAQHEIMIANAYFLPGLRLRRALLKAAHRGVKVVLLLQGKVEYRLQHYATLSLYDELLSAGIEIHEYAQSYLHAKTAVIDGYWATVGSSNIDPFSLWMAREANLVVQHKGFAEAVRESLLHELHTNSQPIHRTSWQKNNFWHRLVTRASYAAIRILSGLTGYAQKNELPPK